MRTTVVFPPDLIRAAKARSAELGESLKTLLTRAVAAELGRDTRAPARVTLPLFGRADASRVKPSNADLEQALADADRAGVDGARRSPSRRPTLRRR
jgi:hypothetical protein